MKAVSGMNSTRVRALEQVRAIVLQALEGHHAPVYLFGSCATGKAVRTSDIDIAIDAPNDLSRVIVSDIRERIEDSTVPYFVDVVDLRDADDGLRRRVRDEGVAWS